MTAEELFHRLAPLVAPALGAEYQRQDLCIMSTRTVVEVARYFGIDVTPVAVRVFICNAAFAAHMDQNDFDIQNWKDIDGSWSVGIGFGAPANKRPGWDGHLISAAGGLFGDFSIGQASRPERGIHIGAAVIGPLNGQQKWLLSDEAGSRLYYERIPCQEWLKAPDWRLVRRNIVGDLIRKVREQ